MNRNYLNLLILILVLIAMVVSYYKYYVHLDYDTQVILECDPAVDVCFYDEESYYSKVLVYTKILDEECPNSEDEDCVWKLVEEKKAEIVECNDDNLESWEVCSNPEEYEPILSEETDIVDNDIIEEDLNTEDGSE